MEPQREGDDEQGADDGELEEGLEHVREHDDVDPEEGELANVGQQVQPGGGDGDGADLGGREKTVIVFFVFIFWLLLQAIIFPFRYVCALPKTCKYS